MTTDSPCTAGPQGAQSRTKDSAHARRPGGETSGLIIAGGGLAGLSLAIHLINSPLRDRSIAIIDREPKDRDDRTWSFWTDRPTLFDAIVYRSWKRLHLASDDFAQGLDLRNYRYATIRGLDFYRYAHRQLATCPNVTFLQGQIEQIADDGKTAQVTVDGQSIAGDWVFDSTFTRPQPEARYHDLKMHFRGWEIETPQPSFDPRAATFLDFRTPQKESTRFCYVLPFSEHQALIEYTAFSKATLPHAEYEAALTTYLKNELGIADYRITREESGVIPITDRPHARRIGPRIMTIGARAGRIKPTTGFAFTRIQRDSAAIVQSLINHAHPFNMPRDSRRYRWYDALLLEIMTRHGDQIKPIFTTLFKRNPIDRVLRFLDEAGSFGENVQLIATLPPKLFLQAGWRLTVKRG